MLVLHRSKSGSRRSTGPCRPRAPRTDVKLTELIRTPQAAVRPHNPRFPSQSNRKRLIDHPFDARPLRDVGPRPPRVPPAVAPAHSSPRLTLPRSHRARSASSACSLHPSLRPSSPCLTSAGNASVRDRAPRARALSPDSAPGWLTDRASLAVVHKDEIDDLPLWKQTPDHWFFKDFFDPYLKREYSLVSVASLRNREALPVLPFPRAVA